MTTAGNLKNLEKTVSSSGDQLQTSVAMCTYNGSRFLWEQLRSIAQQSQKPDELIVCDDGSTDDTIEIVTEFSRDAGFPVQICRNPEKLGAAKNFEQAINLCKGEIIFLSDQDDVWQPEKIESFWNAFKAHPTSLFAYSDAQIIDQKGEILSQTRWETLRLQRSNFIGNKQLERLLKENVITGAGLVFRSTFRELALPIPLGWMHDYWLGLLGAIASEGILIPETLYKYRLHDAQVCGWRKKTLFQAFMISLEADGGSSWERVQQFQILKERISSMPNIVKLTNERAELLAQKEMHLRQRATARSSRFFSRIATVFTESLSGRYSRFSGRESIVRDIITSYK